MYIGTFNSPPDGVIVIILFGLMVVVAFVLWMLVVTALGVHEHLRAARRQSVRDHPGPPHCAACGYDLRASRGRCPECGLEFDWPRPRLPRITMYRGFVIVSNRRGEE